MTLQELIKEKYEKELKEAHKRLCTNCATPGQFYRCTMLPITSTGGDCPYFRKKEIEK